MPGHHVLKHRQNAVARIGKNAASARDTTICTGDEAARLGRGTLLGTHLKNFMRTVCITAFAVLHISNMNASTSLRSRL